MKDFFFKLIRWLPFFKEKRLVGRKGSVPAGSPEYSLADLTEAQKPEPDLSKEMVKAFGEERAEEIIRHMQEKAKKAIKMYSKTDGRILYLKVWAKLSPEIIE